MQFAAYGVEQHYDWHMDLWANKPKNARKLSVSVQLNASKEYEGGSFEIDQSGAPNALGPRSKGAMILFPSYVLHRVQPGSGPEPTSFKRTKLCMTSISPKLSPK